MKKGKRPGETYADVLSNRKMIKEAVDRSVRDQSIAIEADIKTQRFMWMAVIALNEAFGFGGERARRFLEAIQKVAEECEELAKKNDGYYARKKMMDRASQITGIDITPVHEEEMRQARLENEANGIFFETDEPDEQCSNAFLQLPASNNELVRGRWIISEDRNCCNVKCSACSKDYACHYGMLQLQNFSYCPNCGAKMDGGFDNG